MCLTVECFCKHCYVIQWNPRPLVYISRRDVIYILSPEILPIKTGTVAQSSIRLRVSSCILSIATSNSKTGNEFIFLFWYLNLLKFFWDRLNTIFNTLLTVWLIFCRFSASCSDMGSVDIVNNQVCHSHLYSLIINTMKNKYIYMFVG